MSKKATLLLATVLLVVVAIAAPVVFATTQAENGSQTQNHVVTVAIPAAEQSDPNDIERAVPPAGTTGFYVATSADKPPPPPEDYSSAGSYRIWAWSKLQYGPGQYNWDALDNWAQMQLDAGYGSIAFALDVFGSRFVDNGAQACVFQGVEITPQFVLNGPDEVFGTADDPVIVAGDPRQFDCDGNGLLDDPWYLLDYKNRDFIDPYKAFIADMADHIRSQFLS